MRACRGGFWPAKMRVPVSNMPSRVKSSRQRVTGSGMNMAVASFRCSGLSWRSDVTSSTQMLRPCVPATISGAVVAWAISWTATVGKALPPYRIRVVDEAGDDLPQGCEGRLLVQGTTLALPCASVHEFRAVTPGLWYPLGDIAVLDGDGYVQVTGRLDDIEIVGGINVHPAELEELLFRHPMVRDVAACATTDSRGVSRLVAYVVPADDAVDRSTLEADLLAGARGRVAPYKVPRSVVFVPELPRTFTGKLRRRALREAATRYEKTNSWQVCQHGTV